MDMIKKIISSLRAESGRISINVDKKSMIESAAKKEQSNHLEIRNKSIRIIIGNLNNDKFNIQFATTFVESINIQVDFKSQNDIELYFEWSEHSYKITKNKTVITEEKNLPSKLPGGSIKLEVKPMLNNSKVQFILDIGTKNSLEKQRISLFIDKEFNLTLKLFDKKGNEYKLVHKKSVFWEPDLWVQIICSWNKDHAKIRTLNPSNEMDFNESTIKLDNIDLFYMPINPPMIIGTDLTNKYFAKMIISNLNLYDNPII
jgi:hypothetical protein